MTTLPNPIRDILGEIAPPPHLSQSQYEKALAAFIGDASNLSPVEVFFSNEIFRQFKLIEYFQIKRRRAFYDHMYDYVAECYEEDEVKPKTLASALADMKACKSPDESTAISKFCSAEDWDWFELQKDVFKSTGYGIPDYERDIDSCHERIGKLQTMHAAASLTPAMRRRLEAQARILEHELAEERMTINHKPQHHEGLSDEPRAPAGE
ncbi:hypothetical protein N9Y74_00415 [Alphaproteobacteria bacterium]|nr:hypothetical protein [Alphaproteobacteria bacterium]